MHAQERRAEPRNRSTGLPNPDLSTGGAVEGQSYTEWQFCRHFLMHCSLFAFLFLAFLAIAVHDLGNNLLINCYAGMAASASCLFCRWLAHHATDQSRMQKGILLLISVATIVRMAPKFFTAQREELFSLDEALTDYAFSLMRAMICGVLLFPSVAAPLYVSLPFNVALASCNWDAAIQLLAFLDGQQCIWGEFSDLRGITSSATTPSLLYCHVFICVLPTTIGFIYEQQSRSIYDHLLQKQRLHRQEMAAAERAAEFEQRVMQADRASYEEKLRMRSRYVGAMSHDFGTPVAVLQMLLGKIRKRIKVEAERNGATPTQDGAPSAPTTALEDQKLLSLVDRASAALELLEAVRRKAVDWSLLEFGGRLVPTLADFDVASLLKKVEHRISTKFQLRSASLKLCSDANWLKMILVNLASNAMKHTLEGSVVISADLTNDCMLRLEVADTGPGVPAAFVSRLFQPFASGCRGSSMPTTGLGLYHSKQLADALGARMGHEANLPTGAKFFIEAPIVTS